MQAYFFLQQNRIISLFRLASFLISYLLATPPPFHSLYCLKTKTNNILEAEMSWNVHFRLLLPKRIRNKNELELEIVFVPLRF